MRTYKRVLITEQDQKDFMTNIISDLCDKGVWIDFGRIKVKSKSYIPSILFSHCEYIMDMSKERIHELFPDPSLLILPCDEAYLNPERTLELKKKYQEHFQKRLQSFVKLDKKRKEAAEEYETYTRPSVILKIKNITPDVVYYLNLTLRYSAEIYERYFDMIKDTYIKSCQTKLDDDVARTWLRPFGTLNKDLRIFKELNPKYYNVDSTALQNAIRRADDEWAVFFRNCYKENRKLRRKHASDEVCDLAPEAFFKSLPFPGKKPFEEFMVTSPTLSFDGERIKIPKIHKALEVDVLSSSYKGEGRITSATFRRDINNEWRVSFLYKEKIVKSSSSDDSTNE